MIVSDGSVVVKVVIAGNFLNIILVIALIMEGSEGKCIDRVHLLRPHDLL